MDREQLDNFRNGGVAIYNGTNVSKLFNSTLDEIYIEEYSTSEKLVFIILACISLCSTSTAIIILNRSKKIPFASKFLSTGLLSFDALFIVLSTVRKFIADHTVSLNVQTAVTLSLQLASFTVGLMAIERYLLVLKPMWYVKYVSKQFVQRTVLCIWIFNVLLSMFVRYGVCYLKILSNLVFTKAGTCNGPTSTFYGILLILVLSVSSICYFRIFKCVHSKISCSRSPLPLITSTAKAMYHYRSTCLVFIYLMVIMVSSVAYGAIILLIHFQDFKYTDLRLSLEFVSLFNCMCDPFLYVLWFKECRFQLVKILGICLKQYRQRAETMRMDVYNIVISKDIHNTV